MKKVETITASDFYPAYSLYSVEEPFPLVLIHNALQFFLKDNPIFKSVKVLERRIESSSSFTIHNLGGVLASEYHQFYDSFLVMSITFSDDPRLQGIFTAIPLCLMDGYKCFHFHQKLMKSLITGNDEFSVRGTLMLLELSDVEWEDYLPKRFCDLEKVGMFPWPIVRQVKEPKKVPGMLEDAKGAMLERESEVLTVLRNVHQSSDLLVGDSLSFCWVPKQVLNGSGDTIRNFVTKFQFQQYASFIEFRSKFATKEIVPVHCILCNMCFLISATTFSCATCGFRHCEECQNEQHCTRVGENQGKENLKPKRNCYWNNYGDVSKFSGYYFSAVIINLMFLFLLFARLDFKPEKGTLLEYAWHVPPRTLPMSENETYQMWTITINGKSFHYSTGDLFEVPENC
jgi:hypothetical protein